MFQTNDPAEVPKIVSDETVKKTFGRFVVVSDQPTGFAIHGDLAAVPDPDSATKDDVVYYVQDGSLKTLPVIQRFKQCIEPTRDLLGCSECSSRGLPCISGAVHGKDVFPEEPSETATIDMDAYKDRVTQIAGYVYTSPVLLADQNEVFVSGQRKPSDIVWEAEKARREDRKKSAHKAAATRNFKKTNCDVCPAKEGGCQAARWCKGAYPPPDAITTGVMSRLGSLLTGFPAIDAASRLEPWQIYSIMRRGGAIAEKRHRRRNVLLSGLTASKDGLVARMTAYKGKTCSDYAFTSDWAKLREFFPGLAEKDGDKGTEKPTDTEIAYYLAAIKRGRLGAVRRGFQGYVSDPIGWLCLDGHGGLQVAPARPYYVPLSYPREINSWSDYYGVFAELPAEHRDNR